MAIPGILYLKLNCDVINFLLPRDFPRITSLNNTSTLAGKSLSTIPGFLLNNLHISYYENSWVLSFSKKFPLSFEIINISSFHLRSVHQKVKKSWHSSSVSISSTQKFWGGPKPACGCHIFAMVLVSNNEPDENKAKCLSLINHSAKTIQYPQIQRNFSLSRQVSVSEELLGGEAGASQWLSLNTDILFLYFPKATNITASF